MKKCYKCNESKELTEFAKNTTKPDGRADLCKLCKNTYNKEHYGKRKGYYIQKARKVKLKIVRLIREHKNVPCTDCGNSYPWYVMDFDHLRDKNFSLSSVWAQCQSVETVMGEIEKCEVVCSNCHRERTYRRKHDKHIPVL